MLGEEKSESSIVGGIQVLLALLGHKNRWVPRVCDVHYLFLKYVLKYLPPIWLIQFTQYDFCSVTFKIRYLFACCSV